MRHLVISVVLLAGCGSFVKDQAATSTYRILVAAQDAGKRESDVQIARDAMPGGLMQLRGFALAYPERVEFRRLYAENLCAYATAFVFDDWEDAALTGRDDAAGQIASRLERLLASCVDENLAMLPAAWRAARGNADAWSTLLKKATKTEAPALLRIATADAESMALQPMRGLVRLGPTLATLRRCIVIAPGANESSGELLLGSLEANTSMMFGGADGAKQFAAARKSLGAGAIIVDVMSARSLAVAKKDRALFRSTLEKAIATDVSRWPERRLENELALVKARRYLTAIDQLIPPGAPAAASAN